MVPGNYVFPFSQKDRAEQNTTLKILVMCSEHELLSLTWMLTLACIRLFHLILACLRTRKCIWNSHAAIKWLSVPTSCRYMSCHWQFQFKEKTLKLLHILTDVNQKQGNYTHTPILEKVVSRAGTPLHKTKVAKAAQKTL